MLQAFASNLARRHYERNLSQKCWVAWHSVVEARWKQRVEKACQAKAQEVCMALTNDYETKVKSVSTWHQVVKLYGKCVAISVFPKKWSTFASVYMGSLLYVGDKM